MSEMGFAPWYAGLTIGFLGRGSRCVYGIVVQDSSEWQSTDAESGFHGTMGDAGLGAGGDEVEYRGAGGFRAGARSGGDGDERFKGFGNREAFAKRSIDEVEEVCV